MPNGQKFTRKRENGSYLPKKMEKRRTHIVPLSTQVLDIVSMLYPISGDSKYLFPSVRSQSRPMSKNTEMTGHGFRAIACHIE